MNESLSSRRPGDIEAALQVAVLALRDELEASADLVGALERVAASADSRLQADFQALAREIAAGEVKVSTFDGRLLGALPLAFAVAARTGCSLRHLITGVSDDLEARQAAQRAVRTATAGARASGRLLAALPLLGVLLGTAMGAQPLDVLMTSSVGHLLVLVGGMLSLGGLRWMALLVRSVEHA